MAPTISKRKTKKSEIAIPTGGTALRTTRKIRVGEMTSDLTRVFADAWSGLRKNWWPRQAISLPRKVSYTTTRKLYKNDDKNGNLAGFGRRIVNSSVDFTGIPSSASGDEIVDEFLNNCFQVYWRAKLLEALRDCVRDGETVVRIRRHSENNVLVSPAEWEACYLEVVPPETCSIYYQTGADSTIIEKAFIRHTVDVQEEPENVSGRALREPKVVTHTIFEKITPDEYTYWDETEGRWLDELRQVNSWGFVPLTEMVNEHDSAQEAGASDLEAPLPFIMAFHDVMGQSLIAHKAHSIPKALFKVNDLTSFIANNWPDSFEKDSSGQIIPESFSGSLSWKGTEILFTSPEEDAGFMEVRSALGDSKTLLDFILTCISISSETPRSMLMDQKTTDADEMLPFAKKIDRKRGYFQEPIQMLAKMVLKINLMDPVRVPLSWPATSPDIALVEAQTLQQEVMSTEVMATRQVISDRTARQHLKRWVPEMKSNEQEASDAKKNIVLDQSAPNAPASTGSVKGTDAGQNA